MELSGLIEGRFKLLGPLGKDEIGATFLVEDQESGKQVALRRLRTSIVFDTDLNEALQKGCERVRNLVHPHICAVNEFFKQDDTNGILIVMEYVPGETLRDFLFKQVNYRCDEATFLGLAEQILSAIDHAHQAGVTHRDITPDNVMITTEGAVKVIDFEIDAIVKEANFRRWNNPIFLSTYYVSPEQIAGEEPSPSMDIYSLGCLFYEMLAGKLPFSGRDIVDQQPDDKVEPIPGVSEVLNSMILQCVSSDKSERPQLVAEIQSALAGCGSTAVPVSEPAVEEVPSRASSLTTEVATDEGPATELAPEESIKEDPIKEDPIQEARALSREILGEATPTQETPTEAAVPTEELNSPQELGLPQEIGLPDVVPKVFDDENGSSDEWVPEEDFPLTIVEEKGSSRRVVQIGGIMLLLAGVVWWYQSGFPVDSPPIDVIEESAVVEDLQADGSEVPMVEEIPPQQPEKPAESPSSSPNRVGRAPAEENETENLAGQGDPVSSLPVRSPDERELPPQRASLPDGYSVQVGAFRTEVAARRVLLQLSGKSYAGRLVPPGTAADRLYRVSVGDFASKSEASQFQARLKADGFPTLIKQSSGR
jgi:serine/threonine protein kinase